MAEMFKCSHPALGYVTYPSGRQRKIKIMTLEEMLYRIYLVLDGGDDLFQHKIEVKKSEALRQGGGPSPRKPDRFGTEG